MGLSERLARAAARRPQVLLVPVPGEGTLWWAAEDALDEWGWGRAASPSGADVLVCCGKPGPELSAHVEVAWDAMPGPRVRATVTGPSEVRPALLAAAGRLTEVAAHRQDARDRPAPALSAADHAEDEDPSAMQDDADAEKMHDGDMDMDMGSGSDMDMDMEMDTDMSLPGGLVMADRVEDRDGLRLEGLNLSWGPLLPGWPAGLRLDTVLSGDVLTHADVVRLDARPLDHQPEPDAPPELLALAGLAALLEVAGWSDGALRARRARASGAAGPATDDLLRRLRRARLLRWSLRGLPAPEGVDLVAHLDRLVAVATGDATLPTADDERLARDVVGLDLGTASLVLAAHGSLTPVPAGV